MSILTLFFTADANTNHSSFKIETLYSLLQKKTREKQGSWQQYIELLEKSKHVKKAAIFYFTGDTIQSKLAASDDTDITIREAQVLLNGFTDNMSARSNGLRFDNKKYMTLRIDESEIHGLLGAGGVIIRKTKLLMIIGCYDGGTSPGQFTTTVLKLADYFEELGY
jgi:hypothetical protein